MLSQGFAVDVDETDRLRDASLESRAVQSVVANLVCRCMSLIARALNIKRIRHGLYEMQNSVLLLATVESRSPSWRVQ